MVFKDEGEDNEGIYKSCHFWDEGGDGDKLTDMVVGKLMEDGGKGLREYKGTGGILMICISMVATRGEEQVIAGEGIEGSNTAQRQLC